MIEILKNDHVIRTISHVLTASICDKLDGTLTFDFTVLQENCVPLLPGMTVRYDGQYCQAGVYIWDRDQHRIL